MTNFNMVEITRLNLQKLKLIFKPGILLLTWILIWKSKGLIINTVKMQSSNPTITYQEQIKPIILGVGKRRRCSCSYIEHHVTSLEEIFLRKFEDVNFLLERYYNQFCKIWLFDIPTQHSSSLHLACYIQDINVYFYELVNEWTKEQVSEQILQESILYPQSITLFQQKMYSRILSVRNWLSLWSMAWFFHASFNLLVFSFQQVSYKCI